jgi:hypothetical protein
VLHEGELEIFQGGFSQAEVFLEAVALEAELRKKSASGVTASASTPATVPAPSKLSNKDKNRLEKISGEMAAQEQRVQKIQAELAQIDYSSLDRAGTEKLNQLQERLANEEKKLERLLEEWMELEAKQ